MRALPAATVVDLGFGYSPVTALELHDRLTKEVRADLEVVGIEIDPERVAAAKSLSRPGLRFVHGGFDLPIPGKVDVVRAANVLRQYDEAEVWPAWRAIGERLAPEGLIVDATCDEVGRIGTWLAVRKQPGGALTEESFTISVQVAAIERPSDVAARLPKSLIHHNIAGERVHDLLRVLDDAWSRTSGQRVFGPRAHFAAACEQAAAVGVPVLSSRARLRLGELTVPWSAVAV